MQNELLVYIPSDSKTAPQISMRVLLGVPQFLRGILALEGAGFKAVTLLAPLVERRHIMKAWQKYAKDHEIVPHFVWTEMGHKVDEKAFADILANSADNIFLMNANLLVTANTLDQWKSVKLKHGQHLQAVVDRGMAPLVKLHKSDIKSAANRSGKSLLVIEEIISSALTHTSPHPAEKKWTGDCVLATKFTKTSELTNFLTETIRKNTPMWIARNINKRISLPISVILAKLRIHPNSITVFNMMIGMAASIGAAGRTYVGLLLGAIFFQMASIIDGCDGEVAKLTFRCSKFGQYIDTISDNLALTGFFVGLMIHIYRVNNHTPLAFVAGGAILLGFFVIMAIMIDFLKKNTNSASFVTYDKEFLQKLSGNYPKPIVLLVKYGKYLLKKDFFSFFFLVLAIFGALPLAFYIAGVGIWTGIFVLSYLNWRQKKGTDDVIARP